MALNIEMRELRAEDGEQCAAIHREMTEKDNFKFLLSDYVQGEDFAGYLERVWMYKDPATVPEGKVVSTFFIALVDGKVAGRLSVRHSLNEWLALVGGHIGYGVAPEFRDQGVATHMLRHGLDFLNELGIDRCFISCRPHNEPSRRTIEGAGGVFAGLVNDPLENGAEYRTYWIPTSG
jgi:predicted acetyltransferase